MKDTTKTAPTLALLPRGELQPNPWNRKHFNPEKLQELADSIATQGIVQPLVVRAVPPVTGVAMKFPAYEIIAGERRWRAAALAKLETLPCVVRQLDDREARELTAIENLQREDLTAIEEAQGYSDLLKECQCKVEDLEARLGKKRSHIYARLRLLTLPESVKKALGEGRIEASVADLIATIPDAKQREAALKEVTGLTEWEDGKSVPAAMSFRRAKRMVEEKFRKPLKDAPFDLKLEKLAGEVSCQVCPLRTGNIAGLPHGSAPNVCTAPACYARKVEAHNSELLANHKAAGKTVLEGKDAPKWQYGGTYGSGYMRHDEEEYINGKEVLVTKLLGKKMPEPVYAVGPQGNVLILYREKEVQAAMVAVGHREPRKVEKPETAEEKAKRVLDEKVNCLTYERAAGVVIQPVIDCKHLDRLSGSLLHAFVERLGECNMVNESLIFRRRKWSADSRLAFHAKKLLPSELMGLLTELFLIEEPYSSAYDPDLLKKFADIIGVKLDLKAIEKEVRSELKAAAGEAKTAGGKVGVGESENVKQVITLKSIVKEHKAAKAKAAKTTKPATFTRLATKAKK